MTGTPHSVEGHRGGPQLNSRLFADLLYQGANGVECVDLQLRQGRVEALQRSDGAHRARWLLLPELTNAHDHLEFNLYPILGQPPYADYREWAADIHGKHRDLIDEVEAVPIHLRRQWGLLKNLLCGFTRVVDHNEATRARAGLSGWGMEVVEGFRFCHSPAFHSGWRRELLKLGDRRPVMVHLGEGTSESVLAEARSFLRFNLWRRPVVAVHGIRCPAAGVDTLIWCPVSNLGLYGATVPTLAPFLPHRVLFGSDSTLTGPADLWEHLRMARASGLCTDGELYRAVAENPVRRLGAPRGGLNPGENASFVLARRKEERFADAFFSLGPGDVLGVFKDGRCLLADAELMDLMGDEPGEGWFRCPVGKSEKFVRVDVNRLRAQIREWTAHGRWPWLG